METLKKQVNNFVTNNPSRVQKLLSIVFIHGWVGCKWIETGKKVPIFQVLPVCFGEITKTVFKLKNSLFVLREVMSYLAPCSLRAILH